MNSLIDRFEDRTSDVRVTIRRNCLKSKYGIHIAHFWIQSNPESAELVNFWSSSIQIRLDWTGLWIQRIDPVHSILWRSRIFSFSCKYVGSYVISLTTLFRFICPPLYSAELGQRHGRCCTACHHLPAWPTEQSQTEIRIALIHCDTAELWAVGESGAMATPWAFLLITRFSDDSQRSF